MVIPPGLHPVDQSATLVRPRGEHEWVTSASDTRTSPVPR